MDPGIYTQFTALQIRRMRVGFLTSCLAVGPWNTSLEQCLDVPSFDCAQ
jgi:hypothetical protein